jgi:hypothetical protein
LRLSDPERATLAEIGKSLGRDALGKVARVANPDTILAWYRRLIARKFDGSGFPGALSSFMSMNNRPLAIVSPGCTSYRMIRLRCVSFTYKYSHLAKKTAPKHELKHESAEEAADATDDTELDEDTAQD